LGVSLGHGLAGCLGARPQRLTRMGIGASDAAGEGRYKGRKPTARAKAGEVHRLRGQGLRPTEIAERLGIGRASVYRVLKMARA
jgi:DNA invertase Pin-like site-specific DNA recombinase